jgi:hypothetical protein
MNSVVTFPAALASHIKQRIHLIILVPLVLDTDFDECTTALRVYQLRVTLFGKFFGKPSPCLLPLNHSTGASVPFNIIMYYHIDY